MYGATAATATTTAAATIATSCAQIILVVNNSCTIQVCYFPIRSFCTPFIIPFSLARNATEVFLCNFIAFYTYTYKCVIVRKRGQDMYWRYSTPFFIRKILFWRSHLKCVLAHFQAQFAAFSYKKKNARIKILS